MRERIKTPENKEPFINKVFLAEAVEETLAGKEEEEILTEASFWRVFFLYNQKAGISFGKFKNEEAREFYKKIKPVITEILEKRGVKYKIESSQKTEPTHWLADWENKQIDNERRINS